jgi:hypothetical protein
MMTTARDALSKADAVTVATIEAAVPALVTARTLFDRFQTSQPSARNRSSSGSMSIRSSRLIGRPPSASLSRAALVRMLVIENLPD